MAEARGEKIVRSVPRSRCSFSCAFSRLSRIWSSLMPVCALEGTSMPRLQPRDLRVAKFLQRAGRRRVVAVTVDDHGGLGQSPSTCVWDCPPECAAARQDPGRSRANRSTSSPSFGMSLVIFGCGQSVPHKMRPRIHCDQRPRERHGVAKRPLADRYPLGAADLDPRQRDCCGTVRAAIETARCCRPSAALTRPM